MHQGSILRGRCRYGGHSDDLLAMSATVLDGRSHSPHLVLHRPAEPAHTPRTAANGSGVCCPSGRSRRCLQSQADLLRWAAPAKMQRESRTERDGSCSGRSGPGGNVLAQRGEDAMRSPAVSRSSREGLRLRACVGMDVCENRLQPAPAGPSPKPNHTSHAFRSRASPPLKTCSDTLRPKSGCKQSFSMPL